MQSDLQFFDKDIGFRGFGIDGKPLEFVWWRNIKGSKEHLKCFCGLALAWWGIEMRIGPALDDTETTKRKKIQVIEEYTGGGLYVESDQLKIARREFAESLE